MLTIALKDLKLFFGDKRGMLLTFAVPIALITLFAFAFGGAGGSGKSQPRKLVIADEDRSAESKWLVNELDSLEEFTVIRTTSDSAVNMVLKGDRAAVVLIPAGLQDSLHTGKAAVFELKYDEAQSPEASIFEGALYGRLNELLGKRRAELLQGFPESQAGGPMDELIGIHDSTAQTQRTQKRMVVMQKTAVIKEKENSAGLVHAVAGTAIMMLLFSVTSMGSAMLDEKQEGTLKKLLFSPIRPSAILFGKMISVNLISMMQLSVMFIYGWLVFGLDLMHHLPSTVIMIICTAFACSAFGVFLVSFAKSRAQVSGMSTLIILTMSAIGGSMIPAFLMPVFMQKLAIFSVNYWGIQGFYDIFWRDLSLTDAVFLTRVAVLIGIGVGLNFIAVRLFKRNVLSIV
jgi:ABC-2 type transport system permease protein